MHTIFAYEVTRIFAYIVKMNEKNFCWKKTKKGIKLMKNFHQKAMALFFNFLKILKANIFENYFFIFQSHTNSIFDIG